MAVTSEPAGAKVSLSEFVRVARRWRFLVGHLVVIAIAAGMVELGRWQWHVAHARHGAVQNYAYAFQWWIFAVFGVAMWLRIMRDTSAREREQGAAVPDAAARQQAAADHRRRSPAAYRGYVMPQSGVIAAAADPADAVLAGYNDYLSDYGGAARGHPAGGEPGDSARPGSGAGPEPIAPPEPGGPPWL